MEFSFEAVLKTERATDLAVHDSPGAGSLTVSGGVVPGL
tara:strand:- start:25 stop:141 length:117 start_codon:yes stop_codon:yes gene_type:complete